MRQAAAASVLAEFCVEPARKGLLTARHQPTAKLIHSAVDPEAEARDLAHAECDAAAQATLLIGGGLGYLAEAILHRQGAEHVLFIVEPHLELQALARSARPASEYARSRRMKTRTAAAMSALSRQLSEIPAAAQVIIAPYLPQIARNQDKLTSLLQVWRAERASKPVYNEMLASHAQQNRSSIEQLPQAVMISFAAAELIVVAGAGPSLAMGMDFITANRSRQVIIAASGAVPVFLRHGIVPDWTMALEAKDSIIADLAELPQGSGVIVFPSTHPEIVHNRKWRRFAGQSVGGDGLRARGGSSAIPALDFALRAALTDVALLGLDLGHQQGAYAYGANRELAATAVDPPKFAAMRAGMEYVIAAHREHTIQAGRIILHVIDRGRPLAGTTQISTKQLHNRFISSIARTYADA